MASPRDHKPVDYLWKIGVNRVFTAVTHLLETGQPGVRRGVAMGVARQGVFDEQWKGRHRIDVPICRYVPMDRAASGTTLGVLGTSKMKKYE